MLTTFHTKESPISDNVISGHRFHNINHRVGVHNTAIFLKIKILIVNLNAHRILVAEDEFRQRFAQYGFVIIQHRNLLARQCRTRSTEIKVLGHRETMPHIHLSFRRVGKFYYDLRLAMLVVHVEQFFHAHHTSARGQCRVNIFKDSYCLSIESNAPVLGIGGNVFMMELDERHFIRAVEIRLIANGGIAKMY